MQNDNIQPLCCCKMHVYFRLLFFKHQQNPCLKLWNNNCLVFYTMTIDMTHTLYDFDALAEDYDSWYATPQGRDHDLRQKALASRFVPRAEPDRKLLDAGCGTGHWSRFFAQLGYEVTGIDISDKMIESAKKRSPAQCVFMRADVCELPFESKSFDVVAAMTTLEFVSSISKALDEMFRCLKPSGRALVGTLNRNASLNIQRLAEKKQPYISGNLLTPDELAELLEPFGKVRMETTNRAALTMAEVTQ